MIKATEEFLYKEQLNYVGLSIMKTDDSNICLRSINMSDRSWMEKDWSLSLSIQTVGSSNERSKLMIQNYIDVNINFTEHYRNAGKLGNFLL